MPKGNVLKCPECSRTYEQVSDERAWCPNTLQHKNRRRVEMR